MLRVTTPSIAAARARSLNVRRRPRCVKERAKLLDAADNLIEQRMAQARLGTVRSGQQPLIARTVAPAADQHAVRQELVLVARKKGRPAEPEHAACSPKSANT